MPSAPAKAPTPPSSTVAAPKPAPSKSGAKPPTGSTAKPSVDGKKSGVKPEAKPAHATAKPASTTVGSSLPQLEAADPKPVAKAEAKAVAKEETRSEVAKPEGVRVKSEGGTVKPSRAAGKARKGDISRTVDETYVQLTEVAHILKRPDRDVGSVEFVTELMWVHDPETVGPAAEAEAEYSHLPSNTPLSPATPSADRTSKPNPNPKPKSPLAAPAVKMEVSNAVPMKVDDNSPGDPAAMKVDGEHKDSASAVKPRKRKATVARPLARMVYRSVRYVPALYKIVDEPLVNATDRVQRDVGVTTIKVDIDVKAGMVTIWNNGEALPVEMHKQANMWVPEFVFGELRTSSNFDDTEERTTGGRNGLGVKCTNIFSSMFRLEVQDQKRQLHYKQTWRNNMSEKSPPKITKCTKADYTKVEFVPDFARFGMTGFDPDIVAIIEKRVYDVAATCPKIKVFLNGQRIPIRSFTDYVLTFLPPEPPASGPTDTPEGVEEGARLQRAMVFERPNERWEVCVAASDGAAHGFQQMSFVNNVCTSKGGRHVDYVVDQLIGPIREAIRKKTKGAGTVTPQMIKNHLFVFVNALIVNPSFDSQTKMTLTTDKSKFGSTCELSERFIKKVLHSSIMANILDQAEHKASKAFKKSDGSLRGDPKVDKLDDATAPTKERHKCTLILTEGDSAKALAMAGLSVVGRRYFGVFALRGKPVNPRDAKLDSILENKEFKAIKKILGLKNGEKYTDTSQLRYGRIWIMADADKDGVHIVGLIINLLEYYWPELAQIPGFLCIFITPIVKVTRGKRVLSFYSEDAYSTWKKSNDDGAGWHVKWYKGLGTSTALEGKEYFSDLPRHTIPFRWTGPTDHAALELAFSKKKTMAEQRRRWIGEFKALEGSATDEVEKMRSSGEVTYADFVNKQLILYSIASNERHIPSVVDGLKHAARKILFACFKRNLVREIKVASLAGYVTEVAAYQHGEQSCTGTIVNLAQNYVGSNNFNTLVPSGQFGTRAEAGEDAASPRYINTYLNPCTRFLFCAQDAPLLTHLMDEGKKIEPTYYLPVLPLLLINGCHGIGTGWLTDVPPHNPRQIAQLLKLLIQGQTIKPETHPLHPWVRGFRGTILPDQKTPNLYHVRGSAKVTSTSDTGCTVVVDEVPYDTALTKYLAALNKLKQNERILSVEDETTDEAVRFVVRMTKEQMARAEEKGGLLKYLRLESRLNTNNMVAFTPTGQLKRYQSAHEILQEFHRIRAPFYARRKAAMLEELRADLARLDNRKRFTLMVVKEEIHVRNIPKKQIVAQLRRHNFPPMPRGHRAAKQKSDEDSGEDDGTGSNDGKSADADEAAARGYDYLVGMPLWSLTMERVEEIQQLHAAKGKEIEQLTATEPSQLWIQDIDAFVAALDRQDAADRAALEDSKRKCRPTKNSTTKKPAAGAKRKTPSAAPAAAADARVDEPTRATKRSRKDKT